LLREKFNFEPSLDDFLSIHKGYLFNSMQYQCGVEFEHSTLYDFDHPLSADNFVQFLVKSKGPRSYVKRPENVTTIDESFYELSQHMLLKGPSSKLHLDTETARKLQECADVMTARGRFEHGLDLANLAFRLSPSDHAVAGLARLSFMQAQYFAQKSITATGQQQYSIQVERLVEHYDRVENAIMFHFGAEHPLHLKANDIMTHLLSASNKHQRSFEYLQKSLNLSARILGETHLTTASYLMKVPSNIIGK